jgi:nicotinamide mononucleotide transporter
MDIIIQYVLNNWIEITGTVLSLIYLYLSIKQKVSLWIFGFLASALYVVVFFESKLYADMSLQFYYLIVSVYGWINWKRTKEAKELPASFTTPKMWLQLLIATVVIYFVYYVVLLYFTDSTIPKSDSLVGALSVIATWMLARKLIENWLVKRIVMLIHY